MNKFTSSEYFGIVFKPRMKWIPIYMWRPGVHWYWIKRISSTKSCHVKFYDRNYFIVRQQQNNFLAVHNGSHACDPFHHVCPFVQYIYQDSKFFTTSWGPGKHSMSPPGCRPLFLKPKCHKESKNGFKQINFRSPL